MANAGSTRDQNRPILIGLGEVLWDCFPDQRRPGGAPANVAFHANQLGLAGRVCSRVGADEAGEALTAFLGEQGLVTETLQRDPEHETGRVDVTLSPKGQASYVIHEPVAWDFLEATGAWKELAGEAAAVCFGTLAQRNEVSREAIRACLAAADQAIRVYDVNVRSPYFNAEMIKGSVELATVMKLNDAEVAIVAELLDARHGTLDEFASEMQERFAVEIVCITRGAEGCLIASRDEVADAEGENVAVVDTVGAGDSFTAALTYGLVEGWPLPAITGFANRVGGLVASRAGAMPNLRSEFERLKERFAP